jgi:uncharacterized protein (DUF1697 family)
MIYVALFRGVNVGGHIAPMARLKALFEALGHTSVRTYIQSGNVVFKPAKGSPDDIRKKLEKEFLKEFGFASPVILRTPEEMQQAIKANPFLEEKGIDLSRLNVTFLAEKPSKIAVDKMRAMQCDPDRLQVVGREIYLHCPDGYGRTKLSNNALEKVCAIAATTRNWNTVNKLHQLCLECE